MSWYAKRINEDEYLISADINAEHGKGTARMRGTFEEVINAYRQQKGQNPEGFKIWLLALEIEKET